MWFFLEQRKLRRRQRGVAARKAKDALQRVARTTAVVTPTPAKVRAKPPKA